MTELLNSFDAWTGAAVFGFGLIIGSFLNVCIYRMPREESVVNPGSHCTACGKAVAWHDNIPLLSWLLLGAKCRYCKEKISPRYIAVEFLCGILWLGLWKVYGISPMFGAGVVLLSILLAVTLIDFETGLIPDKLSYPGIVLGLVISTLAPEIHGQSTPLQGLAASGLGVLAGGGILYLTAVIGDFIFKKDTMGGGDVKLLAMIGAFLGVKKAVFVFFLAPLPALPLALYSKYIKKTETIPYGPFLAVTAAVFFSAGDKILSFLGF